MNPFGGNSVINVLLSIDGGNNFNSVGQANVTDTEQAFQIALTAASLSSVRSPEASTGC